MGVGDLTTGVAGLPLRRCGGSFYWQPPGSQQGWGFFAKLVIFISLFFWLGKAQL